MSSVLLVNQKHGGSPVYFDSWTIDFFVLLDLWINYGYEHQTNEVNTDQMNNAFDQNQETIF